MTPTPTPTVTPTPNTLYYATLAVTPDATQVAMGYAPPNATALEFVVRADDMLIGVLVFLLLLWEVTAVFVGHLTGERN